MKKYLDSETAMYIVIGVFSAIAFIYIYGIKVLNPSYLDWLKASGGDLTQHYLGWKAYRNSGWHFPIGMADTLEYPHQSSIIFTDSIPVMAVFFKILSPILPERFQYFGLWGILCFVLQGLFAARIIKNFTDNKIAIIIFSVVFLFTPVMLFRMFSHSALAGQWIILLGLEPIFAHRKYQNNSKLYLIAALMGVLSASIHIYFVLMSAMILVGICAADILINRNSKRSVILFGEYFLIAVATMWMLGGFSGGTNNTGDGLGEYSFNLNAFFNAQEWSCIFKSLPLYVERQYEGFAWLGAGFVLLLVFALILYAGGGKNVGHIKKKWQGVIIPLCIVSMISIITACSPVVTFGDKKILEYPLPESIIHLWRIFRSSGRMAWIAVYIIMLCTCILLAQLLNKRTVIICAAVGLVLQVYDSHLVIDSTNKRFNSDVVYNSVLDDDFWNNIAENEEIEHIVYCAPMVRNLIFPLTDWVLEHGMTMSNFYFARWNMDLVNRTTEVSLANPSRSELFIFTEADYDKYTQYDNLHYYAIDGYIVGYIDNIAGFEEIPDFYLSWTFGNDEYIKDKSGTDTDNGRELYENGYSYGPYWKVPAGDYIVTVTGKGLGDDVDAVAYFGHGTSYCNYSVVDKSDSQIVLNLILEQDVPDLEVCVINHAQNAILLKEIKIESKE